MRPKKSRTVDKNSAALGFLLVNEHRLVLRTSPLIRIGGKFARIFFGDHIADGGKMVLGFT